MSQSILKAAASLGVSPETIEGALKGAARASPGVVVVAWNYVAAVPLDSWVKLATLGYIVLQAAVLARKEFFKRKGDRK